MSVLTVYSWPEQSAAALTALAEHALVVVSIASPAAASREWARQQLRLAVRDLLSCAYACTSEQLVLERQPGQVPGLKLSIPGHQIALSISHESGLSIAAIRTRQRNEALEHGEHSEQQPNEAEVGAENNAEDSSKNEYANGTDLDWKIGVDLLKLAHLPDWQAVATLYLGPEVSAAIAATDPAQQMACFALHWAQLEARCKCQGLGLSEWSVSSNADTAAYRYQQLDLPTGYVGALAIKI
ncbi:4'-phosphopantetheinyl transferase family protein [Undibacterium parvum]|uniref:4-phosphopantetheinyl transferase family protein n=1 Tax=Undibacterium parvum TaxID=401471 RepID=A0A3S5HM14_9BURK|nr:4'-phosphopantetheinyl transferase superfamily protein [Undibacterium parvum]AZP13636.1 4-phosphopantetheinyl transferase family protein [Undibacterium parvum]